MDATQKVRTIVAREEGLPLPPPGEGGPLKRAIPKGHEFDPKAIKPLARSLFSSSVALGHAIKAYKEFARIKSSSISPDGLLGGKGYVLKVQDVRAKLQQACELLSSLTDTLHDELSGPHWKPRMADLGENDAEDIAELLDESKDVLDDPEKYGDREVKEIEERNDGDGGSPSTKKTEDKIRESEKKNSKADASRLPGAGDPEAQSVVPSSANKYKEASWKTPSGLFRFANSSLPVSTLPGPRVNHLDRGEQLGPGGSYNRDEPRVDDSWGLTDGVEPKSLNRACGGCPVGGFGQWGVSGLPEDSGTRTEAKDFGIGYGATGQGSCGYGTRNPDGRGVWGPQSNLPDGVFVGAQWGLTSESVLPSDGLEPVARSDYYEGDKGNLVNVPLHGNRPTAQSQVPGDLSTNCDHDRDLPNVGYVHEQQAVPYVKRDWATHNDRNDLQDLYRVEKNG